jgi:sarcosine oxidase subunit gamma
MRSTPQSSDYSGVAVTPLAPAIATLVAGKGAEPALRSALAGACELPDGPRVAAGTTISLIGIGPGRWLAVADGVQGEQLAADLSKAAAGHGSVCDQSDGTCIFRISGDRAKDALAKLVLIDIEAIGPRQSATTPAALIGITLWRPDEAQLFLVAVARSYASAFLHALSGSAAQYGYAPGESKS